MTNHSAVDISEHTESYVVLGLAHCFVRDDGEVHEVEVIEPIPSAALEALLKGIPTSYNKACGVLLGDILKQDPPKIPPAFPESAQICDDFTTRALAAARTYQSNEGAQSHIPAGSVYESFNFSTERKRVLNSERIIKTEDNVKQHEYTHKVL
ncbi:MAG: hypothetical protein ACFB5Z_02595 [Elainellaceae cyanobacterium]